MRYPLDTDVICELRKPAGRAAVGVRTWAAGNPASDLAISVITLMEIEIGVARLERRDARQGAVLRTWLERDLLAAFATRLLPIDPAVARRAASMHVPDPRPERDALVAATALVGNLVVVTRNTTDFRPLGVSVVNPWDA
ncbi:type II toxin-antitoxin system VapC family toxin [Lapillicoccus sp.]|uniref:type II toxin-antitoxin system VapC family toxin n=1 Tax=Lapillicoccus sp. TaxID=1909287 RepID=UPI0025FFAEDB|nr:type II toxin-antitoxin system VapC family toxin [Lapillicoccus sp.]